MLIFQHLNSDLRYSKDVTSKLSQTHDEFSFMRDRYLNIHLSQSHLSLQRANRFQTTFYSVTNLCLKLSLFCSHPAIQYDYKTHFILLILVLKLLLLKNTKAFRPLKMFCWWIFNYF